MLSLKNQGQESKRDSEQFRSSPRHFSSDPEEMMVVEVGEKDSECESRLGERQLCVEVGEPSSSPESRLVSLDVEQPETIIAK